jgi:hypothetical protein
VSACSLTSTEADGRCGRGRGSCATSNGGASGSDRARGDYVTWDRQHVGSASEALAPLSAPQRLRTLATTTTTMTCLPRYARGITMPRTRGLAWSSATKHRTCWHRFWTKRALTSERFCGCLAHLHPAGPRPSPHRRGRRPAGSFAFRYSRRTGHYLSLERRGTKVPFVAGLARRGSTAMFVSRGVGTVYVPVRINCPPEVAVLTLRPADTPLVTWQPTT